MSLDFLPFHINKSSFKSNFIKHWMTKGFVRTFLFPIPIMNYNSTVGKNRLETIKSRGKNAPYYELSLSSETSKKRIIPHYTINVDFSPPPFKKGSIIRTNYRVIEKMEDSNSGILYIYAIQASRKKITK